MFYKKENNNWFVGVEITLPTDPVNILTESKRQNEHGWEWHNEPPQEYLEWLEEQNGLNGA